ncbi:uncharacterized protein BDZ99DRAFT_515024 [Mytilinidion resinicola]|uniref:Uncharacterized protein n=1 Tax=Mytilinidion resinicola TaxID=574789 RepID=A0A6A6Z5Q6_9PEZI|nr:uncharacterized protein BDZ99DRAFT_515024 [Mytilinidion resinicola]KAF2816436.1 hypothetical protein BDZ99DRAFT_515024 [Mytilinidion resinicola]
MCKLLTQIYACGCTSEICTTPCDIAQITSIFCKRPFEHSLPISSYPCKKCLGQPQWKKLRGRMWQAYNESQSWAYRRPLEWVMKFQGVEVVSDEEEEEREEDNGGEEEEIKEGGPGELKVVN